MSEHAPATPATPAPAENDGGGGLSLVAAILLGIAATLTALAAYNAALKDGEALEGYTTSNAALSESNYWYAQGNQTYAGDQQLFVAYATAVQEGQVDLSDYLLTLMRPEMAAAVEWWLEDPDAVTPFDESETNPYVIAEFAEGEAEGVRSQEAFAEGRTADEVGDEFELATVLLALTLFFGGIATLFRRRAISVGLLVVATLTMLAGAGQFLLAYA